MQTAGVRDYGAYPTRTRAYSPFSIMQGPSPYAFDDGFAIVCFVDVGLTRDQWPNVHSLLDPFQNKRKCESRLDLTRRDDVDLNSGKQNIDFLM